MKQNESERNGMKHHCATFAVPYCAFFSEMKRYSNDFGNVFLTRTLQDFTRPHPPFLNATLTCKPAQAPSPEMLGHTHSLLRWFQLTPCDKPRSQPHQSGLLNGDHLSRKHNATYSLPNSCCTTHVHVRNPNMVVAVVIKVKGHYPITC